MTPVDATVAEETEVTESTAEVIKDDLGRTVIDDKFSFKVPEGHPEQGVKKNGTYKYAQCSDDTQAVSTLKDKKWKLVDLVNDELKSRARSNAYQNAVMPYRPSEVSAEDIRARVIRDMIRTGIPEAVATKVYDDAKAAVSA